MGAGARLGMRLSGRREAFGLRPSPPGQKSLRESVQDRRHPAARKNFPMRWEAKVMDRETIKRQIQLYHGDCLAGMERVADRAEELTAA